MVYKSSSSDTSKLALTIYNDNFAVIKETRNFEPEDNESTVHYLDVAKRIETDSIIVNGIEVLELNYDYDLVDKSKLLEKYLDQLVFLKDSKTKELTECRLLSVSSGIVLENMETKEILLDPDGELVLPKLPNELIIKPALIWKVIPSRFKEVNVSYITKGISWESNYVLNLKDETFDLAAWVEIQNHSGTTYQNAQIKLLAGDVNRVDDLDYSIDKEVVYSSMSMDDHFEEKAFADYHIYKLKRSTHLKDNQDKQIKLIDVQNGKYKRYYEYQSYSDNPKVLIEIENSTSNNMGIPLPKGKVKVYQEDSEEDTTEFIGEDRISHTAKDETVTLHIGDAFDIVCDEKVVKRYKRQNFEYEEREYTIKNRKNTESLMKISHYINHKYWEIQQSTDDFKQVDANHLEFWTTVKANEEKKICFKIRYDNSVYVEVKRAGE